ncbi:hypothetical protein O3P69_017854 [Scylla paramamosain]|uniref:C3HC-type domain-containing protein n=2 Tax=Scylla paramamosain TaxID=85552 RepID=A0AAW0THC1_SCYPA
MKLMMETSSSVRSKIEKISHLLGEIIPMRTEISENGNTQDTCTFPPAMVNTSEAFYERLASFGPGCWGVREVTPLEFALYGWKIIQPDVVQCGTCKQVVCATLPFPTDRHAYSMFLEKLKKQVIDGHHEVCWWRHNPCPLHLAHPPQLATLEDLKNLSNLAHILESLDSALPHIDIPTFMAQLGVDDKLLGKLQSTEDMSVVKITAILLTLSGWSRGPGAFLRCKGCCRSVGLWSFVTQAEAKLEGPTLRSFEIPGLVSRKHGTSDSENSEEGGVFVSPEPEDTQSQWRMRLRERRVSEQSSSEELHPRRRKGSERSRKGSTSSQMDAKEEPFVIDTPLIKKQKIQKQYFHPLEEHRPWCPWITKDKEVEVMGYQRLISCVEAIVKQTENMKHFAEQVDGNVQGIRLIRTVLDDVGSEELQQVE